MGLLGRLFGRTSNNGDRAQAWRESWGRAVEARDAAALAAAFYRLRERLFAAGPRAGAAPSAWKRAGRLARSGRAR